MWDVIMDNLGLLSGIVLGLAAVTPFLVAAQKKLIKAIDLVSMIKALMEIVLDSLADGKITAEEVEAVRKQAREVEQQFRLLIGK